MQACCLLFLLDLRNAAIHILLPELQKGGNSKTTFNLQLLSKEQDFELFFFTILIPASASG
jgi:hypothetical protein